MFYTNEKYIERHEKVNGVIVDGVAVAVSVAAGEAAVVSERLPPKITRKASTQSSHLPWLHKKRLFITEDEFSFKSIVCGNHEGVTL